MRGISHVAAALVLFATMVGCGHGGGTEQETKRGDFCVGLLLDYPRLVSLAVNGDGPTAGVRAAPAFLRKFYGADFIRGAPDTAAARTVARGAQMAANGSLGPSEISRYVMAYDQLKADHDDAC